VRAPSPRDLTAPRGGARPAAPGGTSRSVLTVRVTVPSHGPFAAPELLASASGLSRTRIKEAMQKGAVWRVEGTRRPQRLRRATTVLRTGDRLELYYDSAVLDYEPPCARLVMDARRYSVWDKPSGLLAEGSRYGDHATLAHQVAAQFGRARDTHLVHRLDLEASGLLLVAHDARAAARLSALFQAREVDKAYLVEVEGRLGQEGAHGAIELALNGKPARTAYEVLSHDPARDVTRIEVAMASGRYHQIRRHFAHLGHPVVEDPRYGQRRPSTRPQMRLCAIRLAFCDPWTARTVTYATRPDWA
jgi:tRNA pseudouridine32 synthase/23S rRNA pseudouridine746 synthase